MDEHLMQRFLHWMVQKSYTSPEMNSLQCVCVCLFFITGLLNHKAWGREHLPQVLKAHPVNPMYSNLEQSTLNYL